MYSSPSSSFLFPPLIVFFIPITSPFPLPLFVVSTISLLPWCCQRRNTISNSPNKHSTPPNWGSCYSQSDS